MNIGNFIWFNLTLFIQLFVTSFFFLKKILTQGVKTFSHDSRESGREEEGKEKGGGRERVGNIDVTETH